MSNQSFKVKSGITFTPVDLSSLLNPQAGDLACDINDGNKLKRYNTLSSSWEEVGSGAGGINYVENPDAETGTTGWIEYKDAAQAQVEDGIGGTSDLTLTTTTGLRGENSFLITKSGIDSQGNGVSTDFSIDLADRAQVLTISFDYETSANYVDGDVRVYIYDVTNSKVIEVIDRDLLANVRGKFIGTFQTDYSSTDYRLIFHVASSNANAYTITFDNVSVSPKINVKGAVVTDWQDYTPIWEASPTNPSIGNGILQGRYRRFGDSAEIIITVKIGTTTNIGSGSYTFYLPSGLSIDVNKLTDVVLTSLGSASVYDSSSTSNTKLGSVYKYSLADNGVRVLTEGILSSTTIPFSTGDEIHLNFKVPILGWSSNLALSEDVGNRQVVCEVNLNNVNQTVSSTAKTKILLNNVVTDNTNSFDTANNQYIVPETGQYLLIANAYLIGLTANELYNLTLSINGADAVVDTKPSSSTSATYNFNKSVFLQKGDIITLNIQSTSDTSYTVSGSIARTFLNITKISSPQTIAASDNVHFMVKSDNGLVIPNATTTPVVYNLMSEDTHGSYNENNGKYTIPQSGYYVVFASLMYKNTTAWQVGEYLFINLVKNNEIIAQGFKNINTSDSFTSGISVYMPTVPISYTGYFQKGDEIFVSTQQNSDVSLAIIAGAQGIYNIFSATKVG